MSDNVEFRLCETCDSFSSAETTECAHCNTIKLWQNALLKQEELEYVIEFLKSEVANRDKALDAYLNRYVGYRSLRGG